MKKTNLFFAAEPTPSERIVRKASVRFPEGQDETPGDPQPIENRFSYNFRREKRS
jgi:hypothetical protein